MKLYELTIEDENVDEVFAVSLVENPAIQSDFVFFNNEQVQFAAINNEQRIVLGPILIPDKKIIRVDATGEPYEVYFTKETVKKLAQNYLMKKYQGEATLEHDRKIKDVTLVESWIKESRTNDKSNLYNLNLPLGTWVGAFKVNNDEIWNDYVKTGKTKGFSIEGAFEHKLIKASEELFLLEKEITELSDVEASIVLNKIKHILKKDNRFKKKQRVDIQNLEGEMPSIASTYPGEGPDKKKKNYTHPALIGQIK